LVWTELALRRRAAFTPAAFLPHLIPPLAPQLVLLTDIVFQGWSTNDLVQWATAILAASEKLNVSALL